jgi:Zn-dependent M28 family amino/carboxypeptidase
VAFILFDNEEKGLLGSKVYNKKYKSLMEDKLVINFDCVGNGDNIIFIFKDKAEQTMEYKLLREAIADGDDQFSVHYIPFKKSLGNSDHKSFPCSIGVMAANEGGFVRFITGRIHTSRDTVANIENIEFLYNRLSVFLNNI